MKNKIDNEKYWENKIKNTIREWGFFGDFDSMIYFYPTSIDEENFINFYMNKFNSNLPYTCINNK